MDKPILITNVEKKQAKNGNDFLQITDEEGNKYSVFNQADWDLCVVNTVVTLHGEQKGRFFNLDPEKGISEGEVPQARKPEPPPPQEGEPTEQEFAKPTPRKQLSGQIERDPRNQSIEVQVAAYCARDIMVALINKTDKGLTLKAVVDTTTTLQAFILATMQGNFKADFDLAKFLVKDEKIATKERGE